jgi:hypothetical protein
MPALDDNVRHQSTNISQTRGTAPRLRLFTPQLRKIGPKPVPYWELNVVLKPLPVLQLCFEDAPMSSKERQKCSWQ